MKDQIYSRIKACERSNLFTFLMEPCICTLEQFIHVC